MSALIAALYSDHATANRVRVRLSTGDTAFPTDRVHLTSSGEPGHAGLVPAESFLLKLQAYFHTLFDREGEADHVRALSDGCKKAMRRLPSSRGAPSRPPVPAKFCARRSRCSCTSTIWISRLWSTLLRRATPPLCQR